MNASSLLDDLRAFEHKCKKSGTIPLNISERLYELLQDNIHDDANHPSLEEEKKKVAEIFAPFAKDATLAENYRQKGNELFKKKKFFEALDLYNKAIITAPWDSEVFALALGNRAIGYMADEYTILDGISDAQVALGMNYPAQEQHKLYLRLGSAYMEVFSYQEAADVFKRALDKISSLPDAVGDIWRRKCEDLMEEALYKDEYACRLDAGEEQPEDEEEEREMRRRKKNGLLAYEKQHLDRVNGWYDATLPGRLLTMMANVAREASTRGTFSFRTASPNRGKVCVSTRLDGQNLRKAVVASTEMEIGEYLHWL